MKELYINLFKSLNNQEGGFSGKKLSIVTVMACIVMLHVKLSQLPNWEIYVVPVLTIDFSFISACFGLNIGDKFLNKKTTDEQ